MSSSSTSSFYFSISISFIFVPCCDTPPNDLNASTILSFNLIISSLLLLILFSNNFILFNSKFVFSSTANCVISFNITFVKVSFKSTSICDMLLLHFLINSL